jgi:hypothetical protein
MILREFYDLRILHQAGFKGLKGKKYLSSGIGELCNQHVQSMPEDVWKDTKSKGRVERYKV